MRLATEREQIVEFCNRLVPEGLVKGTSGNVSIRIGDEVAISPSSVDYSQLQPSDICVVGMDGTIIDGDRKPSSELPMHLAIYEAGTDLAIVHSHSPFASVLSSLVDHVPPVHYMTVTLGGPIRATKYHTFGSEELARDAVECLRGRKAVLLGSHGGLAVGDTLPHAFKNAITLEWLCAHYYHASLLGKPRVMTDEQLAEAASAMFGSNYGRAS